MRFAAPYLPALLAVVLIASACDPCRKMAKSNSMADKDSAAYCYFEHKQYEAAAMQFEELMAFYINQPRGEKITYMYALSKMRNGELISSAHYFREFIERYPTSTLIEDATYNIGYSYYLLSNHEELDQTDTHSAIEYFQLFKQLYPGSQRIPKIDQMLDEMNQKLVSKAYRLARLYLDIGHLKAAVVALKNFLVQYPDSKFREDATFNIFKAQFLYAQGSVKEKQLERYTEAEEYYLKFVDKFPNSRHLSEAEDMYRKLQNAVARLKGQS